METIWVVPSDDRCAIIIVSERAPPTFAASEPVRTSEPTNSQFSVPAGTAGGRETSTCGRAMLARAIL